MVIGLEELITLDFTGLWRSKILTAGSPTKKETGQYRQLRNFAVKGSRKLIWGPKTRLFFVSFKIEVTPCRMIDDRNNLLKEGEDETGKGAVGELLELQTSLDKEKGSNRGVDLS